MPSNLDHFEGESCYIVTNPSQGKFHLYGDDPREISIEDIANALSKQCRFTGHFVGDFWYGVGEHSYDAANMVAILGGSLLEQYCALMHDTPEAYLADIAAPFKRELRGYYEKEALVWKRIADKFGLPVELPKIVKEADWLCLFTEARAFVLPGREDVLSTWVGYEPHGKKSLEIDYPMQGILPRVARERFLQKYHTLRLALAVA